MDSKYSFKCGVQLLKNGQLYGCSHVTVDHHSMKYHRNAHVNAIKINDIGRICRKKEHPLSSTKVQKKRYENNDKPILLKSDILRGPPDESWFPAVYATSTKVLRPHCHISHLQNVQKNGGDAEPKGPSSEDLLVEEEEMDDDSMTDLDGSIVPKEEPIDIDDMEKIDGNDDTDRNDQEIDDVNEILPKLTPVLLDIKTSPPFSPISEPVSQSGHTAATTSASSTISSSTTSATASNTATIGSQYSLVPTNILMKSSASAQSSATTQSTFKPQQFTCAKSPESNGGTVLTTTNNVMPMKVILVNILQKPNGVSPSSTVSVAAKPIISTPLTTRSLNVQPAIVQNSTDSIVQSTYQTYSTAEANAQASETVTKRQESFEQKETPSTRTFLSQLVQLQQRQLEVSQQRLEVEKERLEYERKTGDKILQVITSLLDSKTTTEIKDEPK